MRSLDCHRDDIRASSIPARLRARMRSGDALATSLAWVFRAGLPFHWRRPGAQALTAAEKIWQPIAAVRGMFSTGGHGAVKEASLAGQKRVTKTRQTEGGETASV